METKKFRVNFRGARWLLIAAALAALFATAGLAQVDTYLPWEGGAHYFAQWQYGPRSDQDFFYIGTWDQSPWNAPLFQGIGFNAWTALYDGTVEVDPGDGLLLPLLRDYKMPVIGDQASALQNVGFDTLTGRPYAVEAAEHLTDPIIISWMQVDEPDNAQSASTGYVDCIPPSPAYYYPACLTYGPCSSADTGVAGSIPGTSVLTLYQQFKAADPNRPVFLGMGQGTGYPNTGTDYNGRGGTCAATSTGRGLNDYPVYAQGGDILDADVYPQNDAHPMWWLGRKADRLRFWSNWSKAVFDDMEMNIISGGTGPTPAEIDAEFWIDVIHGVRGVVWFTHQFSPVFEEASAFAPEHAASEAAMAQADIQVNALARVLNQPSVKNGMVSPVTSSNAYAGINYMMKRYGGYTFLLTTNDGLPQQTESGVSTDPSYPITELSAFCHGNANCTNTTAKNAGSQHMLPAGGTTATFTLANAPASATAVVIGENLHISNMPTIGNVAPYVSDPSDYVSVCGGGFYYDSCGGGVGSLNPDGTFATPATPYYFAPVGPNQPTYAKATAVGAYRTIPVVNGVFTDTFATSYTRHIYQINFDPNPGHPLIGDVNGDGVVNYADFAIVQATQGTTGGMPGYDPRADIIRDGTVNQTDLVVVAQIIADVNHDGVVNCSDYTIVKSAYGKKTGQPGFNAAADINGNGVVDLSDLAIVSLALPAGTVCH